MKKLLLSAMIFMCSFACAQEQLIKLSIEGRPNDHVPVLQNKKDNDSVNLILIPGGNAGTGEVVNGFPSSRNFLVRTRYDFAAEGFNTYILFRANGIPPNQ
jgi:hypothetical protein